jgi:hypothetical protein
MTAEEETAARLAGGTWAAVRAAGGVRGAVFRHFPAVFGAAQLAVLSLPAPGRAGQVVAMPSGPEAFERHTGADSLLGAYLRRPRTRIYEDTGWGGSGWAPLAGWHPDPPGRGAARHRRRLRVILR